MINILSIVTYIIACILIIATSAPHKKSYIIPLLFVNIALVTIITIQLYSDNSVIYIKFVAVILDLHIFVTIKEIFTKL